MAARWIERFGVMAPMEFEELLEVCPPEPLPAIRDLLRLKSISGEIASGPPNPLLHSFLGGELDRLESLRLAAEPIVDAEPLNTFFRRWLS